jgi:predicted DNA-binding protein
LSLTASIYASLVYIVTGASWCAQIYLTDEQKRQLERLATTTGIKHSAMIREAIDGYLTAREPNDSTITAAELFPVGRPLSCPGAAARGPG